MKNVDSIKHSILITVTVSLLLLATTIILTLSIHEAKSIQENTKSLILEQIDLTASKLDSFRLLNQTAYISRTVYHLKKVDGVNIFDSGCSLISKMPFNFKTNWNCKDPLPDNIIVYKADTSISDSNGAPKYVLARIKNRPALFLNQGSLKVALTSLVLILITIFCLNFLIKRRILKPLDNLKSVIGKSGILSRDSISRKLLPVELRSIYDDVLLRDEIIQQNKVELVKQSESQIKNETSQQLAHDIMSPILILRDQLLQINKKDKGKNTTDTEVYSVALNDLELLTKQLLEQSSDFTKEVDISSLVSSVIDAKTVEFRSSTPKVDFKFESTKNITKVKLNHTKFKFILSNIINNAKEASKKSKICNIVISIKEFNNTVSISIKDNGRGIKHSNLSKIFDRGVSINKPGGNGLGLYDAKAFIEKMNGKILVESNYNEGAEIIISLPLFKSTFQAHGTSPYQHILIEDYKLTQLIWLEEAVEKNISFAVFSSPSEFLSNKESVSKDAEIYLDSHFPDFNLCGEVWAEELSNMGFKKIFMCSSVDIDLSNFKWITGKVSKSHPFPSAEELG